MLSSVFGRSLLRPLAAARKQLICARFISDEMNNQIKKMVQDDKVVLFMKGTPDEPLCGFSRAVSLILKVHEVPFSSYNVLDDEGLREGIKEFSDWPTIPQLYINAKFVGGCDIVYQMHQNEELADFLKTEGLESKFTKSDQKPKE